MTVLRIVCPTPECIPITLDITILYWHPHDHTLTSDTARDYIIPFLLVLD